ncbi:RNA-directed DNA polymerase [Clostridium perfringens]
MSKKNNHRNKLDIILTDMQPIETPQIYTMQYFYNYLIKKKSIITANKKLDSKSAVTCPQWHAAPLKYHILKDNNELREISYINLISMIEVCLYLEKYEISLLNQVNKDSFSIRKHKRRKDLIFKEINNNHVEYYSTRRTEASGDFYEIGPYRRLDYFYKSLEWFDLNRKFKYFGKIDYSKCFDSIYTHTFNWLIAENIVDAKNFNKKHFLSETDRLLQNMNMSITNGIVVGPEFSRLLSEVILQAVDSEVKNILLNEGYLYEENYSVKRYVDDIFIFSNHEDCIERIINCITKVAEKYKLRMNDEKKIFGKLPYIWSEWIDNINNYQKTLIDYMFHPLNNNEISYLLKEKNLIHIEKMAKIKELFQNVIISDSKMSVKIVSYCLSILFNKLNSQENGTIKKSIFNYGYDKIIYNLYDFIFYIYSYSPTYNNTEKLISIIHVIENEIGEIQSNHILKKIFKRYTYIFDNGNFSDYVNLIILCAIKRIYINENTQNKIILKLKEENNPILYSVYLIYIQYTNFKDNSFIEELEILIDENLDIIKENSGNIFLDIRIWWIFTFYKCPYISDQLNLKMKHILTNQLNTINNNSEIKIYGQAKKTVIEFYLDDDVKQKIINWNFDKNIFYDDIKFRTFERTLFNNTNINNEIILDY